MPDDRTERKRWTGDRGLRAMVGVGTAILVVAALAIARPVFEPLVFALFVITLVWPLQARLQRIMPKILALAISIMATVVVIGAFGWIMTWAFTRVGRAMIADAPRFQALYDLGTAWLEGHGIVVSALWAEHFNVGWIVIAVQEITSRLNSTLTFTAIVLIYVLLGLLEVDTAAKKLRRLPDGGGQVLLRGGAATGAKLRRYMLVRSLMSATTGVLVAGFVALCGLPLAMEWGVIAFVLNYIPVIGSLIATILPTLFAAAHFVSWESAILVFICLNIIQSAVGSYLEPMVAGNVLSMSPFVVLFSVFFWSYLWGLIGAFIGIPIVIGILTICEQHPASRWVSDVFGSDPGEAA